MKLTIFRKAVRPAAFRYAVFGLAGLGFLFSGSGVAFASARCDAVNAGGFNRDLIGIGQTTNAPAAGFVGEYGGIGANYGVWTANARANWPF